MFIGACECGKRVYSTCTGPVHGRVLSLRLGTAYRGGMSCQSVYWNLCAILYAGVRAVRRSAWAAQAEYFVRVCVYACMSSRVLVYVRVRRSAFMDRVVYLSRRGALACVCTVLGVCYLSRTTIVCIPYVYSYGVQRCSYCPGVRARGVHSVRIHVQCSAWAV